jgi:signal transduction histidine kinase
MKSTSAEESREASQAAERLLWSLSVHFIEDSAASRDEVLRNIEELASLRAEVPEAIAARLDRLRQHVGKVLEMKPVVDLQLEAIVTSPADQYLTEASLAVAARNYQAIDRQQLLQLALIVVGAMLVGYIGALLWLLRLSVRELDAANHGLEETIEKRLAELKRKDQQLFQSQKMESIGQLAAGIAHEINTPMQFVYDNLEFLSECSDKLFDVVDVYDRNLNSTGPQRSWEERSAEVAQIASTAQFENIRAETPKAIRESLDGIRRVISIVRAMKEFSHPGQEEHVGVDLNNAVHTTATMTRNRWKDSADMEFDLDADLPPIRCVPAELNQLLLNMVVNASDAIAEKLGSNFAEKGTISVRTSYDSKQVVIEIGDTGCGMPEEIRTRIFDPFFTTKDPGKGTGQGLSICYNIIVNKLGGAIDVESTPGEGTVFKLTIPNQNSDDFEEEATPPEVATLELEDVFA